MMSRVLDGLRIALIVTLILLCWWSLRFVRHVTLLVDHADALVVQATTDEQEVTGEVEGELTDMRRVTLAAGGAATWVEKAARQEHASWVASAREVTSLLHDADSTVLHADATMIQLNGSIRDLNANTDDALKAIVATMGVAQDDLKQIDVILADPVIVDSLRHVDASTANVDESLRLIRTKVSQLTAPPNTRERIANYLETALKVWFYVK